MADRGPDITSANPHHPREHAIALPRFPIFVLLPPVTHNPLSVVRPWIFPLGRVPPLPTPDWGFAQPGTVTRGASEQHSKAGLTPSGVLGHRADGRLRDSVLPLGLRPCYAAVYYAQACVIRLPGQALRSPAPPPKGDTPGLPSTTRRE
jgi:hypothetical protein